jgi:drug/metabolite transporter (DMT)-like permease
MSGRPLALFLAMSVIWGIPYLFIRIAVAEVSPAFLVLARTGVASAILLPIALVTLDLRPIVARWRWVAAFAAIEIAIPWVLLGSAEQRVSSSLAALIIAAVPLVGVVIAILSGRSEHLGATGLLGLLIGILGVAAIAGGDFGTTDPIAFVELGIVAVCYAAGPVILARRLSDLPTIGVMALSLGLTCLVYVPIGALQWPAAVPSPAVIGSIVTLGVVCTAIAFLVFAALIEAVGPVRATVITYVNPAVAAVLGVVVLKETLTPAMIVGFVLVTVGSVLATRRPAVAPLVALDQPGA